MRLRKWILILILAFAVFGLVLLCWNPLQNLLGLTPPAPITAPITEENDANVGALLSDLVQAAVDRTAPEESAPVIQRDLEAIRAVSERDYELASAIAGHWQTVYLDPDFPMYLHRGEE